MRVKIPRRGYFFRANNARTACVVRTQNMRTPYGRSTYAQNQRFWAYGGIKYPMCTAVRPRAKALGLIKVAK